MNGCAGLVVRFYSDLARRNLLLFATTGKPFWFDHMPTE